MCNCVQYMHACMLDIDIVCKVTPDGGCGDILYAAASTSSPAPKAAAPLAAAPPAAAASKGGSFPPHQVGFPYGECMNMNGYACHIP